MSKRLICAGIIRKKHKKVAVFIDGQSEQARKLFNESLLKMVSKKEKKNESN